jgi:hypothetical protein
MTSALIKTFGFLLVLAACVLSPIESGACTLMGKSLSKFDDQEYVFIGKVVGYTDPVAFDERKAAASIDSMSSTSLPSATKQKTSVGLKVQLTESVYLPKAATDFYEIYVYDLWADCSIGGTTVAKLAIAFPIGAEVRVISREATLLTEPAKAGIIRLEDHPGELGSVALNTDSKTGRMTTAKSLFDYKSYTYDLNSDSDSKYLLPAFEIRKDLLRLQTSKTQGERNAILDRLYHVPRHSDLELRSVFETYAGSQSEADRLYDSYLLKTDPESYRLHKMLQQVTTKLIDLGFSKSQADAAIMSALENGAAPNYEALVKETARILKVRN